MLSNSEQRWIYATNFKTHWTNYFYQTQNEESERYNMNLPDKQCFRKKIVPTSTTFFSSSCGITTVAVLTDRCTNWKCMFSCSISAHQTTKSENTQTHIHTHSYVHTCNLKQVKNRCQLDYELFPCCVLTLWISTRKWNRNKPTTWE